MGFRNPGPNTSQNPQPIVPAAGQYTAEDHSWESITIQQGRPPTDWEMNLMQEALGPYGFRRHFHRLLPSCFLTGGYLEAGSPAPFLTFLPALAANSNQFQMPAADVFVNGWMIRLELSGTATAGVNQITLPAPPLSGTRTDLIILEVWRSNVLPSGVAPPVGQTTGLSQANQVFRFGNAKAPDSPVNVNLANDLIDPTFLQETSRRVQIQYRYRVIPGIASLTATPDGFDDPSVFANTVPLMGGSGLDGSTTTYAYTKHPIDPGLWVAGNGDQPSVTAMGTEDGNMYAIPMFAVFRRNSGGFNRATNLNGGVFITAGTSDRPDGYFADQIVAGDVKDLRKSVAWDLSEVRARAFQELLDNNLSSEHEISQNGAEPLPFVGPGGTSFMVRDNIGTSAHPGNPDAVRMNFSDRSVTESIVCKLALSIGATTATFNLNALPVWWSGSSVNVLSSAPSGTSIVGLGQVRLVTTSTTTDLDLTSSSSTPHVQSAVMSTVVGPGADQVVITLSAAVAAASTIYVELLLEYPSGNGVRRNVVPFSSTQVGVQVWTPPALNIAGWVDSSALTATSDVQRFSLASTLWWMSPSHRELSMRLRTISQSGTFYSADTATVWIPEIITGSVTINDGLNAPYTTTAYSFNTSYTKVALSFPRPQGTPISVTYTALRPAPPVQAAPGDSYQVFYETRAVQSIAVPAGKQTVNLYPRSISDAIHVITSGSGSPDDGFPFVAPSSQFPVGLLPAASFPEAALDTPASINVVGLGINTGYMALPALVPYSPDPQQVQLFKDAPDVSVDADGRNFWSKSQDPATTPVLYAPQVFGQVLQFKQRHKMIYPVLMELKQDFQGIGRKGTLVLVVFTRWTDYDNQDSISMSTAPSDSCAAVYRVRGNLINPRRVSP